MNIQTLHALQKKCRGLTGAPLLSMILREFELKIVLLSSFGTEAVVSLHMVAQIDPDTPVVHIDTGRLFPETLQYREELELRLGLTNVIRIGPTDEDIREHDRDGYRYEIDPPACCAFRKKNPLELFLLQHNCDGWITGRRRAHGGDRSNMESIELVDGRLKINPLAFMTQERLDLYCKAWELPPHPLAKEHSSVGCTTCTIRHAASGRNNTRQGRLELRASGECGLHVVRKST